MRERIRKAFVYLDVDKNALVDAKDYHLKVTSLGLKQEFDVSETHFDQLMLHFKPIIQLCTKKSKFLGVMYMHQLR